MGRGDEINEEYLSAVAGKTFQAEGGQMLTFYEEGVATYDFRNGVGENHHYAYVVTVVDSSDTQINMLLETVMTGSDNYHTEDYIDNGPEEAVYFFADDSVFYYQTYTGIFDPGDPTCYSNSYGAFNTVCAEDGCKMFIAPSGNTKYCAEHTGTCDFCGDFLDPDVRFCPECPACLGCGADIAPDTGWYCSSCAQINKAENQVTPGGGKCYWCNGTGAVKYYYGSNDLEAYLTGHDPYWYGQCGSCGGTGIN